MASGYKRKIILINPRFQLKVSAYFAFMSVINIAVFYGCIRYFFQVFIDMGQEIGLPKNHVYFMFMEDQMLTMNIVFLVTAALTIGLIMFFGVFISHKVAGPMYRFNNHLNDIADGNKEPGEIKFRDGDFFPEIAESFNRTIKK
tara:strand:+ start:98 stop:529 length:432 start_codon:yes stop_codon:yes gene_type:complete